MTRHAIAALLVGACGDSSADDGAQGRSTSDASSDEGEGSATAQPGDDGGSASAGGGSSGGGSTDGSTTTGGPGGGACTHNASGEGVSLPVNTWVQVDPVVDAPPGGSFRERGYTSMIYSGCLGAVVSWEGYVDDQTWFSTIYSNALWTFDTEANQVALLKPNNWTRAGGSTVPLPQNETDPTPVDRHPYGCFADAPERGGFVVWGGANQTAAGGHPTDAWSYNADDNSWAELPSAQSPPVMLEAAMAYHAAGDVLVLHGNPQGGQGRTFEYDFAASTWSEVAIGAGPGTRSGTRMVYDPVREVAVLFGGGAFASGGNALWTYDPDGGWTDLAPDGPPQQRRRHGFAYDTDHDVFVVFGGNNPSAGQDLDDTWIYDPATNTWAEAQPSVRPPSTGHVDMAYDAGAQAVVARLNQTWWLYRCG